MPKRDVNSTNLRAQITAIVGCALLLALAPVAQAADTIRHIDGTVVTGKITKETPDDVTIETAYGTLVYQKRDLVAIDREPPPEAKPKVTPTPTPDISTVIPSGPVNPMAPPLVQPLVNRLPRSTSATLMASTASLQMQAPRPTPTPAPPPTPVAPAPGPANAPAI